MLISARQLIVLCIGLLALGGGIGGLVIVSQNPPPPPQPPKIHRSQRSVKDVEERAVELKAKKPIPKATLPPPLAADNLAAPVKDGSGSTRTQKAEKKVSAQNAPNSLEKPAAQTDDESIAAEKLKQGKAYQAQKNFAKAKECFQEIIDKYSHTKALDEAILIRNELK
jgi:hypothetical protein